MDFDEKIVNYGVTNKKASDDTKEDFIVMVIDRSGSMGMIRDDAQGGINSFIDEQKTLGRAKLTISQFDTEHEMVCENMDITNFELYELKPRGSTALYDAIGFTGSSVKDVKVSGSKIFVVVTDGQENSSREWRSKQKIKELISEMKEDGWDFVFLAADEETIDDAVAFGMDRTSSFTYAKSGAGADESYRALASYTTTMRTSGGNKAAAVNDLDDSIKRSKTLKK